MEFTTHGEDQGLGYMYRVNERWYGSWDEYSERVTGSRVVLHVVAYPIVKETPKGKWILVGFSAGRRTSEQRFVLNTAHKRYAHETKEDAMAAFKARRERQIAILSAQLDRVRTTLAVASYTDVEKLECY